MYVHNRCRMQANLDEQRAVYQPVAVAAAALYLALGALPGLSHMYRFSQAVLLAVFSNALRAAATSADVAMRIASIQAVRQSSPYMNAARAALVWAGTCSALDTPRGGTLQVAARQDLE